MASRRKLQLMQKAQPLTFKTAAITGLRRDDENRGVFIMKNIEDEMRKIDIWMNHSLRHKSGIIKATCTGVQKHLQPFATSY